MTPDTENHSQQPCSHPLISSWTPHGTVRILNQCLHCGAQWEELRRMAHLPREESATVTGTHKAALRALLGR